MPTVPHFQSSFSAVNRRIATEVLDFAAEAGLRLRQCPPLQAGDDGVHPVVGGVSETVLDISVRFA